ncbi:BTB/POZ domain-containing protein FBL11 isoform X2 [Diospyros lotus]|nr:BTB/POZ domain-containing protein FBL11 isoform X2 [Diospyros lotus]
MASNPDNGDGDGEWILLRCTDPHLADPDSNHPDILVSTSEISSWDFPVILTHQVVSIKATRNRLTEQSSYFRGLLCGSFSESCLNCISIQWNQEIFMSILMFIFGFPVNVTANNFPPLFEAALFFGVDMLLSNCKAWLIDATSSKGLCSLKIQVDDVIHIWKFGIEHVHDFIPERCTSYLARNFMWAMYCEDFPCLPFNLLVSCVKHVDLTVDSERHLADALIVWLTANAEQFESLTGTRNDCSGILKEIRFGLLPLWFVAGKRRCRCFYKFAKESIEAIHNLMAHQSKSTRNASRDDESCQLKIRLTKYTKKVDLSGCPHMNTTILLISMLPGSYNTHIMLSKYIEERSNSLEHLARYHYRIEWAPLPTLSFDAVEEVDISNCRSMHLEAAVECLSKSFPSLRVLTAAHFLNFKTKNFCQLVLNCPLLEEVDLTVDVSPIIPTQVSILSSSSAMPSHVSAFVEMDSLPLSASRVYMSRPMPSNITKLTLEGRVDVNDYDLKNISEFCSSLHFLNVRGCTSITDAGISGLILRCVKLDSLLVCDTSFGHDSVLALLSAIPDLNLFPDWQIESNSTMSLAFNFQVLHMGGCKCPDEALLLELMSQTPKLKSLCLRETEIGDRTLHSFYGSSLEMLDVSNTEVSGAALAHIITRNPGLKCLKAKSCRNLFHQKSMIEGEDFLSPVSLSKEWYMELGKTCKFEEIELGWGFSLFSLEALKPAITPLRAITVGLGASLGQKALELLPVTCPLLESVVLYFQVITDHILMNLVESLRHLKLLALCHCLGEISSGSFKFSMPNLRKLRLERVTPWMTNDDLVILTQSCANLIELSLLGCRLLNSDSQQIISSGWPGLISVHLEDCGEVTRYGVASLFECKAVEDILLRHNGPGIQRNFILDAASKMPMLRKLSLDTCDASECDFDLPDFASRYSLSMVKIARCKRPRCAFDLRKSCRAPVHRETLVLVWNSKNLTRTIIKER